MRKIENRCCDCATDAYPCRGSLCPLRSVEVVYCDGCGGELDFDDDGVYGIEDEDLCVGCFLEKYRKAAD